MPHMQYPYLLLEDAIEDRERKFDQRNNVNSWSLGNLMGTCRVPGDLRYRIANPSFGGIRHHLPKRAAVGGEFDQITNRPLGVFNFHTRRNARKAAATCSSVAVALRSAIVDSSYLLRRSVILAGVPALNFFSIIGQLCLISLSPMPSSLHQCFKLLAHAGSIIHHSPTSTIDATPLPYRCG